ncbi:MAG TPA: DUF3817 domain-containing protein [Solirubrobacterales bacterium]
MTIERFRRIALLEATTFLILLVASVVKNTGGSELGVKILGPIHGLLFVVYVLMVWQLHGEAGWTRKQTVWILVGAVLPFGGYVVDWWLARRERIAAP